MANIAKPGDNTTRANRDNRLSVAVLMGGASSEREVSLATGREILLSLDESKYAVTAIDKGDLIFLAPPTSDVGYSARPDVVFIALHGKGGEDGSVQGMLEVLELPYTGSGVLASALAMNKTTSKRLFAAQGIPVIAGVTVSRVEWGSTERAGIRAHVLETIGCPAFVKPNAEGSTFGCTLVQDPEQMDSAIDLALTFDEYAIIERYTRGIEITVGLLEEADGKLKCLPPVEIVPRSEYYDYDSKYADGGSEHVIPARISDELTALAWSYAIKCHTLLGCRGMSRTDVIVSDDGTYVLEVNTIPGMTPTSLLPQAAAHAGIKFPELLDRIIDSAMRCRG